MTKNVLKINMARTDFTFEYDQESSKDNEDSRSAIFYKWQ